jgi:hypothetical protein
MMQNNKTYVLLKPIKLFSHLCGCAGPFLKLLQWLYPFQKPRLMLTKSQELWRRAKAIKSAAPLKKKWRTMQTAVTFHRLKTLKRARNPQYPCISVFSKNKLNHYKVLKYPLATKSTMKKTEDNNSLSFSVDARADNKKIKDAFKEDVQHSRQEGQHPIQAWWFEEGWC